MDSLIGYPLMEALDIIQHKYNKIIEIKTVSNKTNKHNNLDKPYVIRDYYSKNYVTLYISYF